MSRAGTVGVPISGTGFALRQVILAPALAALRGPLTGRRQLPLHLDASARAVFDFSVAADREQAYQLVLLEAGTVSDLEQWLDGDELLRLWPDLYLPRGLRAAWRDRHPELAPVGAGPHVPQL
jgi:hypothetical protein